MGGRGDYNLMHCTHSMCCHLCPETKRLKRFKTEDYVDVDKCVSLSACI